jgi:hypothetical protein
MRKKFKEAPEPWLQRKGETAEAYAAFSIYRDLGPRRSIDRAYRQHLGNKRATDVSELTMRAAGRWTSWSVVYSWQPRALAYDRHLARTELAQREKIIRRNGILWAEERRQDVFERLEICRNLRRAIRDATAAGLVSDTRRRHRIPQFDGSWITVDEHVRLTEQLRLLLKIQETLFPSDSIAVDDESPAWTQFAEREVVLIDEPLEASASPEPPAPAVSGDQLPTCSADDAELPDTPSSSTSAR